MAEEDIRKAIKCFTSFRRNGEIRVQFGRKQFITKLASSIVEDETNYDAHEHRASKMYMVQEMVDFLQKIAEERYENPGIDVVSAFKTKKGDFCRRTLGGSFNSYTLAFPLNILGVEKSRLCFETPETKIKNVDRYVWKDVYEKPARKCEDSSFKRFLDRESPNSLEPDDYGNKKFTFWKAEYDAQDGSYALSAIQNVVRFFLAKLNYALYNGLGKTKPSGNKPPYARISPLQEPFFYLVYDGNMNYNSYHPMDFEYRRRQSFVRGNASEILSRFDELPRLSTVNPDLSSIQETLMNALLAYQEGVTTSILEQSFLSFWRGIENLAQIEKDQSHREIMSRVEPIFRIQIEDEPLLEREKNALRQIRETRSRLVHEGSNLPHGNHRKKVTEPKQLIAKRMIDNIIEFFLEYYEEGYNSHDFQTFLKYIAEAETKNAHSLDILKDVIEYRD